jgi:Arm DNA-binding domain
MPKPINETSARTSRIKLTKRSVESLPSGNRPAVCYDDRLAGFGVRVMPSGRRFYFVRYRNKHGVGEHGKVTADAARTKAQRVLQTVAIDEADPSSKREGYRTAPTVSDLLDRYITEHVERQNKPRTQVSVKGIVSGTFGRNSGI